MTEVTGRFRPMPFSPSPLSACQKRGRRRSNKRKAQREAQLSLAAHVSLSEEDISARGQLNLCPRLFSQPRGWGSQV
jgi:hypothetical protein